MRHTRASSLMLQVILQFNCIVSKHTENRKTFSPLSKSTRKNVKVSRIGGTGVNKMCTLNYSSTKRKLKFINSIANNVSIREFNSLKVFLITNL